MDLDPRVVLDLVAYLLDIDHEVAPDCFSAEEHVLVVAAYWHLHDQARSPEARAALVHEARRYWHARIEATPHDQLLGEADPDVCAYCGCTDEAPCEGGCFWLQPGRCSKCAHKTRRLDGTEDPPGVWHDIMPTSTGPRILRGWSPPTNSGA